ncbi:MAG: FxLD family lanthipeptide [Egibacteraceae bacterium]
MPTRSSSAWRLGGLNVSIVESGPVIDELMRLTDDGCGTTCESACPATGC